MEEFNAVEEIKKTEESLNPTVTEFDPSKNPDVISIVKQPDGNYKGYAQRFGKLVTIRGVGPETVLQELLVNNGK